MAKRRRLMSGNAKASGPGGKRRRGTMGGPSSSSSPSSSLSRSKFKQSQQKPEQRHKQRQHTEPVIPFSPSDAILLVGEGDLSFAKALIEHHGCENVTATVLERDLAELLAKYPHAGENVEFIESSSGSVGKGGCRVLFGVDARKMAAFTDKKKKKKQKKDKNMQNSKTPDFTEGHGRPSPSELPASTAATTAAAAVGIMDRIIFNFPHVGGKSTDVNRQVRHNQELLVDFFGRALASLRPGGSIVVTLFEGEPYTLWNVRDLARHSGLQVGRSFAFRPEAYPGYRHARTLGAIRDKRTGEAGGGGWRGEERPARSFVFYRAGEVPQQQQTASARKRRRSSASSSSGCDGDGDDAYDHSDGDVDEEVDDEDDDDDDDGGNGRDVDGNSRHTILSQDEP